MKLTTQQNEAKKLILEWFTTIKETKKLVFSLLGYAGTGKSFLISHIAAELGLKKKDIAFATPTGKASEVLIRRGIPSSTIHRLIYTAVEEEYQQKIGTETVRSKRIKFVKRDKIGNYKLIIIDEISMVDETMMRDLMSFAIPIIVLGDNAQLPPILGENPFIKNPDYFLTEIVRQSLDNPIIKIATMARNKEKIPYGNYGTVLVLPRGILSQKQLEKLMLKADQIICGTNATRIQLNNEVRKMKGIDTLKEIYPVPGDKVIFSVNNWEIYLDESEKYNLVNGTMGTIVSNEIHDKILNIGVLSFRPNFLDTIVEDIVYDIGLFATNERTYDMHQRVFLFPNNKYKLKKYFSKKTDTETYEEFQERIMQVIREGKDAIDERMINSVDFAYAISAHKSQGDQWDNVLVFDESYIFQEPEKWLYTVITRAKKRLVIIR